MPRTPTTVSAQPLSEESLDSFYRRVNVLVTERPQGNWTNAEFLSPQTLRPAVACTYCGTTATDEMRMFSMPVGSFQHHSYICGACAVNAVRQCRECGQEYDEHVSRRRHHTSICAACHERSLAICGGCGSRAPSETLQEVFLTAPEETILHHILRCPHCLGTSAFVCQDCGRLTDRQYRKNIRSKTVCHWCVRQKYATCICCSEYRSIEKKEIEFLPAAGNFVCLNCKKIRTKEDLLSYRKEYGARSIRNYSTRAPLAFRGNDPLGLYFGVELEVVCKNEFANEVAADLSGFAILKFDSSIGSEQERRTGPAGFEIVTSPATIEQHEQLWAPFFKKTKYYRKEGGMRGWDAENCGMHVHVSRRTTSADGSVRNVLTDLQVGKIQAFVHNPENRGLIQKIAGRSAEVYGSFTAPKKVNEVNGVRPRPTMSSIQRSSGSPPVVQARTTRARTPTANPYLSTMPMRASAQSSLPFERPVYHGGDPQNPRRTAVNTLPEWTIEFRMYRSTLKPSSFLKNLEFAKALVMFTMPGERSITEAIKQSSFLKWLAKPEQRKAYPNLVRYIAYSKRKADKRFAEYLNLTK